MKILALSNLYPPNAVGGYERLCYETAMALADRGHEVHVLTSTYGNQDGGPNGNRVIRGLRLLADDQDIYRPFTPGPNERLLIEQGNAEMLFRSVSHIQPDLLFVWNLFFLDAALFQKVLTTSCTKVYLLTDNWLISFLRPEFWQGHFARQVMAAPTLANRLRSVLAKMLMSLGPAKFKLPGTAIFPSVFMRELYMQAGFSFDHSLIIPHGVAMPDRSDQGLRNRNAPCQKGQLRLLFAGRVVEIKGTHTAIDALPQIIADVPESEIQLTILGDTRDSGYVQRLREMVRDRGLEAHVNFQPPVSESELFHLFQQHDIYLFPSLYEPFSLTLIHALGAGIPTVASDVGGNAEIVHHGQTGLLFAGGNAKSLARAVVRVHRDQELRSRISLQAKTVAREYTFSAMIAKIETALEQAACVSPLPEPPA